MRSAFDMKGDSIPDTPLLLLECTLPNGTVARWATHHLIYQGQEYDGRVLSHSNFELKLGSEDGVDSSSRFSVIVSNIDSYVSEVETLCGWRGARLTVRFVFYNLAEQDAASDDHVVFLGIGNSPDEITESTAKLSFTHRLSLLRAQLPQFRVQTRCPWVFPSTAENRAEGADGTSVSSVYSRYYPCGYSPDALSGRGNFIQGEPFTSCSFTKTDCQARGMYDTDSQGRSTSRFGGFQFLPPGNTVRTFGASSWHWSEPLDNRARANDAVPLVYGTVWYDPPVIFSKNDGNLTHCEVLLGMGPIQGVHKVIVAGVEMPQGVAGRDMTATGWYNVVSLGQRDGAFNLDFADAVGAAAGDPHGGMAILSVVVPSRLNDGHSVPKVEVLVDGLVLPRYGSDGTALDATFSNNPAWILLDLLQRSGWRTSDLSLPSFAHTASYCDMFVDGKDALGNPVRLPRFQCNLAVVKRRSVAELIRGVRITAALLICFDDQGKLQVLPEANISLQQPSRAPYSNATTPVDGGWVAFEFGDGSSGSTGILRRADGTPAYRLFSRSGADCPNRVSVEFQNALNDYQQDSVSVIDPSDVDIAGMETNTTLPALGIANFDQAARLCRFWLRKGLEGNRYIEFESGLPGFGVRPGDLISVSIRKEGLDRVLFRVVRVVPGENYQTVRITAQWHIEDWYTQLANGSDENSDRRRLSRRGSDFPRRLVGCSADKFGASYLDVAETEVDHADGSSGVVLQVRFTPPVTGASSTSDIPLIGISPEINPTGGALSGGQTLYYAVTGVDVAGGETGLSFVTRASIAASSNTNTVVLTGLSFAASSSGFRVYRGPQPDSLLLVADVTQLSSVFVDPGLAYRPIPAPDPNYDHAHFYWRIETLGKTANSATGPTFVETATNLAPNSLRGKVLRVLDGVGLGQEREIIANDDHRISLGRPWSVVPSLGSNFVVAESGWRFGGSSRTAEIAFEVPNIAGATIQISGRACNLAGTETTEDASLIDRYELKGATGPMVDLDVPPAPIFGLTTSGSGEFELTGVGFTDFSNTRTISAGTLAIHQVDELSASPSVFLARAVEETITQLTLTSAVYVNVGQTCRLGNEVVRVLDVTEDGMNLEVQRGVCSTIPMAHSTEEMLEPLARSLLIVPFVRGFFGSLASGDYRLRIELPNTRLVAAELFMTNSKGDGPIGAASFASLPGSGLRSLSGGQYTIQIQGHLTLQTDAVPPITAERPHVTGSICARLAEPPVGGASILRLKKNGDAWCDVVINDGQSTSETIEGVALCPLQIGDVLSLDILAVPSGVGTQPGRDLTLTIVT